MRTRRTDHYNLSLRYRLTGMTPDEAAGLCYLVELFEHGEASESYLRVDQKALAKKFAQAFTTQANRGWHPTEGDIRKGKKTR